MELTGAQILLESLKKEGVDVLFGYPGGAVIDIYDELPRHPELKHVLVRHEQGAVHAAVAMPVTVLVAPGPEVTREHPTLPEARA